MRYLQKVGVTLVLGAALLSLPAMAADMDDDLKMDLVPELGSIEARTGWYVRGDAGYLADLGGDSSYRTFDGGSYTLASGSGSYSKDVSLNLGVGYTFTDMFRADVTFGRISSAFEESGACDPSFPAECERSALADFAGYSVLANGYVDLGTIIGLTPYVGAGAGYTYLKWDDVQTQNRCGSSLCNGSAVSSHPGESGWRFTYALMAGVAYDVSDRLKLDVGYRYMNIDGGGMYGWDVASSDAGATGFQGGHDNISTHEIRVGLRIAF